MVGVLQVLRDASEGKPPYGFVDATRRAKAADAVARGTDCILRTQVKQEGKLTVWCAQHDEFTFAPAWARNFEPPSLSGNESVGIVRFLMGIAHPSPEVIAAIEGAVAWFQAVPVHGLRVDNSPGADGKKDRRAVADPAAPVLWARFYELGTNRPIFIGRDKVIRYDFNAIERERRTGYGYLGDWPAKLLAKDYPAWRAKHPRT
jgi:PelA/Pel-15E family pectate lyase